VYRPIGSVESSGTAAVAFILFIAILSLGLCEHGNERSGCIY
jgi:hypothetical protein